jgi:hypothetical protein
MKQNIRVTPLLLILSASLFIGCGRQDNKNALGGNTPQATPAARALSPTETMTAYYKAMIDRDTQGVKKYLSQDSIPAVTQGHQGMTIDDVIEQELSTSEQTSMPVFSNEKIIGDSARVDFTMKDHMGSDRTQTMPLVKESGMWKIALDKYMEEMVNPPKK